MFTVKFLKFHEDSHSENCIRCMHYEARRTSDGAWGITVYPAMTATDGVEWWVKRTQGMNEPLGFNVCYVENEDGKTIAKYCLD